MGRAAHWRIEPRNGASRLSSLRSAWTKGVDEQASGAESRTMMHGLQLADHQGQVEELFCVG